MTAFPGLTPLILTEDITEQTKQWQRTISQNRRQVEELRKQRLRVEEEIIQCNRVAERRVELMMEKCDVVDMLQQLGHMLQEERHLSEQLNGHAASEDRNEKSDLQEKSKHFTNKARCLTAEILEVKQRLAEAKARNVAAKALIHAPTSKSKQNQSKRK